MCGECDCARATGTRYHGKMEQRTSGGRRVAFFGGSFDPPHYGHLAVARAAQAALGLDTVLFAPVGAQPLKTQGSTAAFAHRLAMTRLAIAGDPCFAVSLVDAPNPSGEPNYTLETLLALRAELPPHSALFCLMGADAFATLRCWHRAAEIPFVAPLIVASRPGESLDDLQASLPDGLMIEDVPTSDEQATEKVDPEGGGGFNPRIKPNEALRALAPEVCFPQHFPEIPVLSDANIGLRRHILRNPSGAQAPFYLLPGLEIEISASEIRDQLRVRELPQASSGGQTPEPAPLPAPVSEYIRAHNLYR